MKRKIAKMILRFENTSFLTLVKEVKTWLSFLTDSTTVDVKYFKTKYEYYTKYEATLECKDGEMNDVFKHFFGKEFIENGT